MPGRKLILIFLKYPEPGRVKTRLAADLGEAEAVRIYCWLVGQTLANLPPDVPVRVLHDAGRPEADYREWLGEYGERTMEYRAQHTGDLGQRLEAAFDGAFADGWEQVAVIGSDCPEVTPDIFAQGWTGLASGGVVIGPSTDGGYYYLGLRALVPELFRGIPWSTEGVLAATEAAALGMGLRVVLLPGRTDVDTAADWSEVVRKSASNPGANG